MEILKSRALDENVSNKCMLQVNVAARSILTGADFATLFDKIIYSLG